jgi:hypothetical protein
MKMDLVANSGNDEFYTPEYAIDPIMKHIPAGSKIWCPFDTEESLFVQKFSRGGCVTAPTYRTEKIFFNWKCLSAIT